MSMYTCRFFTIQELVGPNEFETVPAWKLWQAFDYRLLWLADHLRSIFGPCTVNNWVWGGMYKESGLRVPGMISYSPWSQHTRGRALDLKFSKYHAEEVREWLKTQMNHGYKIQQVVDSVTVEEDVPWVHVDVRNNKKGYNTFKP